MLNQVILVYYELQNIKFEIHELRNGATQNDVTLQVTNWESFIEIIFELLTGLCKTSSFTSSY